MELVKLTVRVAEDPALTEESLVEFTEYLASEFNSGRYTPEESELFADCLAVCSGVYFDRFAA